MSVTEAAGLSATDHTGAEQQRRSERSGVSRAENQVLWRIARREMRSNPGRTALVAGFTLFGMLCSALAVGFFGAYGSGADDTWVDAAMGITAALPSIAIAQIPTMLIIAAGFSASTKRRTAQYRRLRTIGARDSQILRLVTFEAMVPAAFSAVAVALVAVGLFAWFDGPVVVGAVAVCVAAIITVAAIAVAARLPARSVLAAAEQRLHTERGAAWDASVQFPTDLTSAPQSPVTRRSPMEGLGAVLVGAVLMVVTAREFSFWLPVLASLLIFAGALTLLDPIVGRLGRLAPRLHRTGRFAVRDADRNRTRSVSLIAAGIGLTTLAVMASAGVLSDVDEYGTAMDARFIVGPGSELAGETFVNTAHATVAIKTEAPIQALDHPGNSFILVVEQRNGWTGSGLYQAALYSDEFANALALPPVIRAAADTGTIVVMESGRVDGLQFGGQDLDFVHHPIGLLGSSSRGRGNGAIPSVLVPPGVASELELRRQPAADRMLIVARTPPTEAEKATISTHGGENPDALNGRAFSRNQVEFAFGGLSRSDEALIAAAIAGVLGILLGLFGAGLAGADSNAEISTMVAAGARPSIRRRILATQTWTYLTISGVFGSVLGVVLFWAVTRSDASVPDPIFPWLTMAVMTLIVPVVTAVLVALLFRSAKPAQSRRAEI